MRRLTVLLLLCACSEPGFIPQFDLGPRPETPDPDGGPSPMLGIGEFCQEDEECRRGLACGEEGCEPGGTQAEGQGCVVAGECGTGLQCVGSFCALAGAGVEGAGCEADTDCGVGLRCALVGLSTQCKPAGNGDVGGGCGSGLNCRAGLACLESVCTPAPPGVPSFVGGLPGELDCAESSTPTRAFFEVAGAPAAQAGDFFRLPFPNDAIVRNGRPDLSGFPRLGEAVLGFDPVDRYLEALSTDFGGWSSNPTVLFRFSAAIDFTTFRGREGIVNPVQLIDVTPGGRVGRRLSHKWFASNGGGRFVCPNWLAVRQPDGVTLQAGNTYAVVLTTEGRSESGGPIQRSQNFEAMLAEAAPDQSLAAAYAAYAPLRAFLEADEELGPDDLLNAAVFTAGDPMRVMAPLAETVAALPVPAAEGWTKCGPGVASPCPDAEEERACGEGATGYDEYHALVRLPVFQRGTVPYVEPEDGGGIDTDAPVREENVCLALAVPNEAEMPEEGWPLVVFAHGTGGHFRSHISANVAGRLRQAGVPGAVVPFAVLGFDQVLHGPRRGASDAEPKDLFFNYANPQASVGNPIQGAADQISMGRFAQTIELPAELTGGGAQRVNPERVLFWGQSQGATHGAIGVPFSSVYKAAVLSGNGAGLVHALLDKRNPVDIAAAVPFALQDAGGDGRLRGGEMHPVLSLLQTWLDVADPLNFAKLMARAPAGEHAPKHVFGVYGTLDTYTPARTLANYAVSAGMPQVSPDGSASPPEEIARTEVVDPPHSGNVEFTVEVEGEEGEQEEETHLFTSGFRQYGNSGDKDGHFVAFDVSAAAIDLMRFLGMASLGEVPQIGN